LQEASDVEMLTNGSFASGYSTEWEAKNSANLSHANGELTVTSTQNYSGVKVKSAYLPSLVAGRKYVMTINLKSITNSIRFGVVSGATKTSVSTAGRHKLHFTGQDSTSEIFIEKPDGSNSTFVLKSVSIRELNTPNGASNFTPQVGDDRQITFEGVTKINTDAYFYLPTGDTVTRDSRSGRGFFAGGGTTPNYTNAIDFITISSSGNAQDFGDLTQEKQSLGGTANSTRGIFASGYNTPTFPATGNNTDRIEYITTATTGNGIDFGNLDSAIRYASCAANSTRGLIAGGYTPTYIDRIEYITIASLGNAQTFGTLTTAGTATDKAGLSSPTRALFAGGEGPSYVSQIDYVTIASTGNAQDFGDLTASRRRAASASSGTRGLVAAGYNGSAYVNTIDYVTMATTGNAQDFGDTYQAKSSSKGQVCSAIRGVFGSGATPSSTNTIDYVTIASTGNANDFGDTRGALFEQAGCSDSHGGLG